VAERPFEGIRVVELAQWVFVPVAGALLADWGADVLHIEPPQGDPYRGLVTQGIGAAQHGVNLSMAMANRGKRSLSIDVRSPQGKGVLAKLLDSTDVLLTSLRPKALERLGLDADSVRERYPRLVFARGHGYGVRGEDANRAGYDASAFWARGGLAHILTPPDRDFPVGQRGAMGDRNGAMALAFGVASALLNRERTGQGCVVDVSLLATAMWTLSSDVLAALGGAPPAPTQGRFASSNPLAGMYRTQDDRHIQLVFLEADRYWPDLCRVMGRDDLLADARFADIHARAQNARACIEVLDEEFAKRTFDEWKQLLTGIDVPWAPIQSVPELIEDPQVVSNGYLGEVAGDGRTYRLPTGPVQLAEQPPELRRAPELGEHTETVLLELGYDWEDISGLRDAGVLG
jgi:crotonobetainyl-CoA:carnitine CoA-transferase CaiB-like acyl-CoA transferase